MRRSRYDRSLTLAGTGCLPEIDLKHWTIGTAERLTATNTTTGTESSRMIYSTTEYSLNWAPMTSADWPGHGLWEEEEENSGKVRTGEMVVKDAVFPSMQQLLLLIMMESFPLKISQYLAARRSLTPGPKTAVFWYQAMHTAVGVEKENINRGIPAIQCLSLSVTVSAVLLCFPETSARWDGRHAVHRTTGMSFHFHMIDGSPPEAACDLECVALISASASAWDKKKTTTPGIPSVEQLGFTSVCFVTNDQKN